MAVNTDDLKFQLAAAATEAATATKNAVNLAVTRAAANEYNTSGSVSAMAVNCANVASNLAHALAELETAFPSSAPV